MIRNYLRIALRNISRQMGFTLLNITGLAIGLASATFIYLFIIFSGSIEEEWRSYLNKKRMVFD